MYVYNGIYTDPVGRELGYPEVCIERNFDTTEAQRVVFERAVAAGATLLYGTNAGVLPHDMGGWQFEIMVERGMTSMQAIYTATSVAASHLVLDDKIGAVQEGFAADIIAVRGNLILDLTRLRHVSVVLKEGVVIRIPASMTL